MLPVSHDWSRNAALRAALTGDLAGRGGSGDRRIDVICTYYEVNSLHGAGILVERLFQRPGPEVVSIRGQSDWGGMQTFGVEQHEIPWAADRREVYAWTLERVGGRSVRHLHLVPFGQREIHAALAIHDAYKVPLCLYVMDDENIFGDSIPDDLMAEAIDKATLRLAISSDMRDAYEAKYNRRFWLAPPTIPDGVKPLASPGRAGHAVIIGNIWAGDWVHPLAQTIRGCGLHVDWFCNNPGGGHWIDRAALRELKEAGVALLDPLPPRDLALRLSHYEAALMPTIGTREAQPNLPVAMLSLPSRVPTLIGAGDLPIIVLGDAGTCVARFVEHFAIGTTSPYRGEELRRALELTRDEAWRRRQRQSLARLRGILGGTDIAAWLQTSLVYGRVLDPVFESLTVDPPLYVRRYEPDSTPPLGPWLHTYDPVRAGLARLAAQGYAPDFIIDAGASTGVWSYAASRVFPDARFVLIEPLLSRHDAETADRLIGGLQRVDVCECALGERDGEGRLTVNGNPYQAHLSADDHPDRGDPARSADPAGPADLAGELGPRAEPVPVRTLDSLARDLGLAGRGILKLDIQGGELNALRGGPALVHDQLDAIVAEVTIDPPEPDGPSFADIDGHLREAGFTLLDELGSWREPSTGMLLEKDVLYVKRDHPIAQARRLAGHRG